ncbi:PilZ domain-containing protein [Miltoncostaea marina]|uniref:PilZ domain-containing protein n=1 Tax=Miltoncostaea marina TaxID=2843215 RepID=UPI001C3E589C|nr:PilZ domain-containing protein [Miltoncostaea marina]
MRRETQAHRDAERRTDPRLPLGAEVVVRARERSARGRTVDASASGVLVRLDGPLSFLAHQVGLEVALPDGGGVVTVEADVVRRGLSEDGALLLALRFADDPGGRALARTAGTGPRRVYGRRVRPSRARPAARRPPEEIRLELRALGTRALELAMLEPEAPAPAGMVRWLAGLARELGLDPPEEPPTARMLTHAIADLHRAADGPRGRLSGSA